MEPPDAYLAALAFSGDRRLMPHQVEHAVDHLALRRSLNASETGSGKFLTALALRRLIERDRGGAVRVVYTCPKTALAQFEQEFSYNGYKTFILRRGTDVIPRGVDTVLVANSTRLVTHRDHLREWHPELVIVDEAQAFKSPTSQRTKALYGNDLSGAGGVVDRVPFVLAMSGTFAPNHNGELFTHLRALIPGALMDRGRVMRRHVFEATFCQFGVRRVPGGMDRTVITGSRNTALLSERVMPYVRRVKLRDIAAHLPPERHEVVPLDRQDIKLDEITEIAGIEDPEVRRLIEAIAVAIRDGTAPASDIDRQVKQIMQMIGGGTALAHLRRAYGIAKLPYVEDVVLSHHGVNATHASPVLIFNSYHLTGDLLQARLSEQGIVVGRIFGETSTAQRNAVIAGIQDGTVEAAILQIDAAGSALNLQAANRIIMLEPSWAPGSNHQAVARAVRIGQKNPVLVSWPVIRHSIDEYVLRRLREKQEGIAYLWGIAS